jgi:hypothetical protein
MKLKEIRGILNNPSDMENVAEAKLAAYELVSELEDLIGDRCQVCGKPAVWYVKSFTDCEHTNGLSSRTFGETEVFCPECKP